MMSPLLDAKWILFVRVAELGTVSRASIEFDLPQSVVSRRIGRIEAECGSPLFRRTGRGVALTDFGQLLYSRIKCVQEQAEDVVDEVRAFGGAPIGLVKVGLLPVATPLMAGELFADIQDSFPFVRLHLVEGTTGQLEQWLAEGRLDLSLLLRDESTLPDAGEVLARQSVHLVVRKDNKLAARAAISLGEVALLPLVLASRPHALREMLDRTTKRLGVELQVVAETDSIRVQHEVIASGRAFGLMLGALSPQDRHRLESIPVSDPGLSRAVVMGQATQRPSTLATREVARRLSQLAITHLSETRSAGRTAHQ